MIIDFGFEAEDDKLVMSDEAGDSIAGAAALAEIYAVVIFRDERNEFRTEDDLQYFLPALCWGSQPALQKGEPYTVSIFSYPGRIHFKPQGRVTEVSDDDGSSAVYPTVELQAALLDCGLQFLGFMEKMAAASPIWKEAPANLRRIAAESLEGVQPDLMESAPATALNNTLMALSSAGA